MTVQSCSITATNYTTPHDIIFPHKTGIIMVPEVSTNLLPFSFNCLWTHSWIVGVSTMFQMNCIIPITTCWNIQHSKQKKKQTQKQQNRIRKSLCHRSHSTHRPENYQSKTIHLHLLLSGKHEILPASLNALVHYSAVSYMKYNTLNHRIVQNSRSTRQHTPFAPASLSIFTLTYYIVVACMLCVCTNNTVDGYIEPKRAKQRSRRGRER